MMKNRQLINEICLSGMFLALFVITFFFSSYVLTFIGGFYPTVHISILCLAIFSLNTIWFKTGFCLLAPLILWPLSGVGHPFFDFMLPYWGFFLFIFLDLLTAKIAPRKKHIKYLMCYTLLFMIIGYVIQTFSYFISGILFWNATPIASISLNATVGGISFAIVAPIVMLSIYPVYLLKRKIQPNLYY